MLCSPDMIDQIIAWAHQAGQIALHHFKNVSPQHKSDRTFLTQADLEIESFLAERIRTAYPDYGLIGEEGTQKGDRVSPSVWVIDPLDGTTAFVWGLPGWGISIGLLERGRPCFGLFYMPLLDDIAYTNGRGQVYCNEHRLERPVRSDWEQKGFLAVSASAHHDFQIDVRHTRALGSVGANLVYTARGSATAAFLPKARLWDLVAGAAILTGAGGELCYLSGRPVDYEALLGGQLAPEPIIAGHPKVLAGLQGAIRSHPTSHHSPISPRHET